VGHDGDNPPKARDFEAFSAPKVASGSDSLLTYTEKK